VRGHGAKFPRKKQLALAALIECDTIKEAAKAIGVGEATLFRWLQHKEFQDAYRDAKRKLVDQAITSLQKTSGMAVQVLKEIMRDPSKPASSRVTAARIVLENAVRAREIEDLERRVEQIERRMEGRN
jgi:DNA-binding MurR/RpiR family transcriptional regulator